MNVEEKILSNVGVGRELRDEFLRYIKNKKMGGI